MKLELTLQDPQLCDWLEAIPEAQRSERVIETLRVGHQVLTLVRASSNEDSMNRMFKPVVDEMTDLKGLIKQLMHNAQKSQRLGELGESAVQTQLQNAFPNDRFTIHSGTGHQGDVLASFDLGDGARAEAIIEVKLYTNEVPSKELVKFRKDLVEQRCRYGVMVSLTSRLTGIREPFDFEARDGYLAVFVPNAGLDGVRTYWAVAMIKALARYEQTTAVRLSAADIERAWERLSGDLAQIQDAAKEVGQFREQIQRARASINKSLDGLVSRAITAEMRLRHLYDKLHDRVRDELGSLPASAPTNLPSAATADDIAAFLTDLADRKSKYTAGYQAIEGALADCDVDICIVDGRWQLFRDGTLLAETLHKFKGYLQAQWFTHGAREVAIELGVESPGQGAVVIKTTDVETLARLVARRVQP